jgi:hypothetical protein
VVALDVAVGVRVYERILVKVCMHLFVFVRACMCVWSYVRTRR